MEHLKCDPPAKYQYEYRNIKGVTKNDETVLHNKKRMTKVEAAVKTMRRGTYIPEDNVSSSENDIVPLDKNSEDGTTIRNLLYDTEFETIIDKVSSFSIHEL